ncbi:MAG: DUF2079 domain-containing protein [Candidatus Baltobacteraceae bacterium]
MNRFAPSAVWVASCLYAATWFALGVRRYDIFRSSFDDGIFTQILASAFSGFRGTPEWNFNHLASHFSPDLFLVAPLVILTHSTISMIAVQAIAVALVAPPLFLIARKRMPESLAAGCAIVALLYPPLAGLTFADFHENGIAPTAIVWLLWAIDAGKGWIALAIGLFALGIKEDMALGIFGGGLFGGLWLARRGDRSRAGIALGLAACAALTFVGYLAILRPALHPPFPFQQFRYYTGEGLGSTTPAAAWDRARYVVEMLLPLGFIPLLGPAVLLAIPGFVEILASRNPITMSLETQYAAVWIGYMLFAFVAGVAVLHRRAPKASGFAVAACAAISLYVLVVVDPLARWYALYRWPNAHDATLQALLDSLPRDASISAPDRIYSHLGFDPNAGIAPGGCFFIIDRTNNDVTPQWAQYEHDLPALVAAGTYRLIRATDGIELYERRTSECTRRSPVGGEADRA